ncbi:MAG: hypothetical protein [Wendovervirus sonii]|uniref:DUF932 domain-containing protein n=1 Tax=phage Lak_Megaphage_Sonny TaxID=3109229 RepID=A0ABZ0Z331_9CAUD|nr:MAG: hypothetical protein [phage Lak_Megaphage_Sonny]
MNTATATQANEVINNAMSLDDMRRIAPRIFCTSPTNPGVSKHYTFASTLTVINDMAKLSWDVVSAAQPHPRRVSSISSYHKVTFRNGQKISRFLSNGSEDVYYPEIVLTNSHDGFSSFCFRIGLYSVNTQHTIIISTDTFNDIRLRHIGYSFEDLRNLVNMVIKEVPNQIAVMNKMQNFNMTIDDCRKLAAAAFSARNKNAVNMPNFILDEILKHEDGTIDNNLWDVFNTIMHRILEGDFQQQSKKGMRKARKIVSVLKTISISQAIFNAAFQIVSENN